MRDGVTRLRHALSYPRLYIDAAHTRRRLRALGRLAPVEALALARSLGLGPTQSDEEIVALLELLERERPRTVVEIGVDEGGTLLLWTRVAADDALLVAIDDRPLGLLGSASAWAFLRRGFARDRQRVHLVVPADSHTVQTLTAVERLLAGRAIDFLFVDGDHSFDGVKADFETYAPLVRPGGIVAFHDVATSREPDVVRFWSTIRDPRLTEEIVATREPRYGIGLYRVPAS